jgi:hypothetical protein
MATKIIFVLSFFASYLVTLKLHLHHFSKIKKSKNKVTKQEQTGFSRLFLLLLLDERRIRTVQLRTNGSGLGCPSKLVSIRNNRNWNRNVFRHYPKHNVCFGCFASIPKQRVSMFRLNRNKQKTNRNSLTGSIFCHFLQKIYGFFGFFRFFSRFFRFFGLFRNSLF